MVDLIENNFQEGSLKDVVEKLNEVITDYEARITALESA